MTEGRKEKNVPFRMTPERHKELKILAAQRGQSMQELAEEAVAALLNKGVVPTTTQVVHRQWHQRLDEIFASGDTKAIQAVQQNIEVFWRLLRAPASPVPPAKGSRSA